MNKISFQELKEYDGKELDLIKAIEEPTEPEKGIIKINGTNVLGCFKNKVSCNNDTFAFIHFYNKQNEQVANISVFNVENESLIIYDTDNIVSETSLRVMNQSIL